MKSYQAYTVSRDGVVKYVGVTVRSLAVRWRQHCKVNSGCRALAAAIRKYGTDAFVIEHVASARDIAELGRLERDLIAQYNTLSPKGYNLRTDNMLNSVVSEETRVRLRASHVGIPRTAAAIEKHRRSMAAVAEHWLATTGKKLSPEHCAKISGHRRGKLHTAAARLKMSIALSGKTYGPLPLATRLKIGAAHRGRINGPPSEITRAKQRANLLGKPRPPRSPEWCARIRVSKTGIIATSETREKMSLSQTARRNREKSNTTTQGM